MAQVVNIEVPFEQLLAAVDRLDIRERDMLRDRLTRQEEAAVAQQAEQAVQDFKLPGLAIPLSYWSVNKVLDELDRRLKDYEQKFGLDSKSFYVTARGNTLTPDEEKWSRLYETYQRLKAAKRQVDLKAGRGVEPLTVGQIVSRQLSLAEVKEKLNRFEQQHNLSSAEFYESFKQGQQGDSAETFAWLHTYSAYLAMTSHDQLQVDQNV
jgi:hypothetical protein